VSTQSDMDQYRECGAWLPAEDPRPEGTPKTPCPKCGSTKQIKYASAHIESIAELKADAQLLISWQEVDRLLAGKEYAAALLVAAVNVEFILWENLHHFSKSASLTVQDGRISSMWGQVTNNHPEKLTLSSLRKLAEYVSQHHGLVFVGSWRPVVGDIENVRNRIAHERGYFAKLTRLKELDWPESRIRQVLADAKQFCHANG